MTRSRFAWVALFGAVSAAPACGSAPPRLAPSEEPPKPAAAPVTETLVHRLAEVNRPSMGPFRAVGPEGDLLVWVVTVNEGAQLVAQTLFPDGAPKGAPKPLGLIPFETRALVVKPLGKGFVVCYTSPQGENDAIDAVVLGEDGRPLASATEIVKTPSPIGWFDVVPNKGGVVAVWAETTASENAAIFAVALDTKGAVVSAPSRIANHAVAWQLHEAENAVVLGAITALPQLDNDRPAGLAASAATGHTVLLQQIDQEGRALGAATIVAKGRAASRDLDFYDNEATGQTRVVWTELDGGVPRPVQATVEHRTVASNPEIIESAKGGGRVLSLTKNVLMWRGPVSANRVYLTDLTKPKDLRWSFDADDGRPPEFLSIGEEFALLGLTRLCPQTSSNADACDRLPKRQTLARFHADLTLKESTQLGKLTAQSPDPAEPTIAWSLHCTSKECSMLGATGTASMQVSALRVPNGFSSKATPAEDRTRPAASPQGPAAPAATAPRESAPSPTTTALQQGKIGTSTSVLSGFTPQGFSAPEGKFIAVVGERDGVKKAPLDDAEIVILGAENGAPGGEVASITKRALARGGVALAAGPTTKDGYALAWVALEQGDPEVHLSHLDKTGHRVSDMLLTTSKGDARNVSVRWVGDGYVIAWIDGRDGSLEVYTTKVNPAFERITRQNRITNGPGDASDLVMVRGEGAKAPVFLSWVKPSGPVTATDVYIARISAHNSERIGAEQRVLASPSPSRRPHLTADKTGGGVSLLWLEDEAAVRGSLSDQAFYGVSIDASGKLDGAPVRLLSLQNAQAASLQAGREGSVVAELHEGTQSSLIDLRLWEKNPGALRLLSGLAKKTGAFAAGKAQVWYADPRAPGILRASLTPEP